MVLGDAADETRRRRHCFTQSFEDLWDMLSVVLLAVGFRFRPLGLEIVSGELDGENDNGKAGPVKRQGQHIARTWAVPGVAHGQMAHAGCWGTRSENGLF